MAEQDDALDVLWKHVLEDWDNPKAHDAFVQMAFDREALGEAAARYKSLLDDEERQELAKKKLGAVVLLATQVMEASKSEGTVKTPRWLLWLAAAICAGTLAVLAYALSA